MKRIAIGLAMVVLIGSVIQMMGQAKSGGKATPGAESAGAGPADQPDDSSTVTSRKAGGHPAAAQPAAPVVLVVRKSGGEQNVAASGGGLQCTSADGSTACTAQQVADVNSGVLVGRRQHEPYLATVKGVTQGSLGMLVCTQDDGSACTDEQVSAVITVAGSTHSSAGAIRVVRETDEASPLMMRKAGGDQNEATMLAVRKSGGQMNAAMKCTDADGSTACSDQQVYDLNQGILTGRRMHEPLLMNVKGVTQGGAKGTIVCTQDDGSACTDDQVSAVISAARSIHSTIRIVREVDRASP